MMRKINLLHTFFVLLAVAALLPVVKAEVQTLGTFQQLSCVNLIQTCGNCTAMNLSVVNPRSEVVIPTNTVMTKTGTLYNYTFCNTSVLGQYIYNTVGNPDGIMTTQPVNFVVTTTGKNNGNTLPLFLLLGAAIVLGFASYLKNEYVGLLSGFLFIVSGVYMMIYGLGLFNDDYTRIISYVSLGVGLMIGFISIGEMFFVGEGDDD